VPLFRRRQSTDRFAFLPRLVAKGFLQQLTKPEASLGQLGLGIPDRASQNLGNIVVFISLDIVENEHFFVSIRQLIDSLAQIDVVKHAAQPKIRSTEFYERPRVFLAAAPLHYGLATSAGRSEIAGFRRVQNMAGSAI